MKRFAWEAAVAITLSVLAFGCDDSSMFHFEDDSNVAKPSEVR